MKYIVKIERLITMVPEKKTKISYVSQLHPDSNISCSANIKLAHKFDSYETAWLVAKTKKDKYYNEVDVTVMGVE